VLRTRIAMTHEQFAARIDFSVANLSYWERRDRSPQGPALVLLNVIDKNPAALPTALQQHPDIIGSVELITCLQPSIVTVTLTVTQKTKNSRCLCHNVFRNLFEEGSGTKI